MATTFQAKKQKILEQLEIPNEDYTDLSPKGSVDEGVRELVDEINKQDGFVTTSSCAGRVAVYLEGISKRVRQDDTREDEPSGIASGGKGGGQWLYVSHDPPNMSDVTRDGGVCSLLGLPHAQTPSSPASAENTRFVRLKFEPLVRRNFPILATHSTQSTELLFSLQILHILTASLSHAKQALSAALTSGFRESGISSITSDGNVMLAVRTAGLAFDSVVAYLDHSGHVVPMVDEGYLRTLLQVSLDRFQVNTERKERFREALLHAIQGTGKPGRENKEGWEPADERRERKRAEGLRKKAEMQQQKSAAQNEDKSHDVLSPEQPEL